MRPEVDVPVEEGTVVIFDARLLHAAHPNTSTAATRYSVFGHYVPGDLHFSWRGEDFSRGTYADRHVVVGSAARDEAGRMQEHEMNS